MPPPKAAAAKRAPAAANGGRAASATTATTIYAATTTVANDTDRALFGFVNELVPTGAFAAATTTRSTAFLFWDGKHEAASRSLAELRL